MLSQTYKYVVRPILFLQDAEKVHNRFVAAGRFLGEHAGIRKVLGKFCTYTNKKLETTVAGIKFKNPVGLAAGFDKNAQLTQILPYVGFGFEEVGSITAQKHPGNPGKRLFRLPKDRSIVVNYGLCNEGAETLSRKLKSMRYEFPIAVSFAKTNICQDVQTGIKDYLHSYDLLKDTGDFLILNISCPNTPDDRSFSKMQNLDALLHALSQKDISKPLFIKIKPEYDDAEVDALLSIVSKYPFITGFVISNLTRDKNAAFKTQKKDVERTVGAFSGMLLKEKSTRLISQVYKKTNGAYTIIGVGGIFSAQDAYEKIKAGASLVELITGMIYEGPLVIKRINKGLVKLLEKDGYSNISEAVGKEAGNRA